MDNHAIGQSRPIGINETAPAWGRDISGFAVFSGGPAGQAHVLAHTLLDQGRADAGRQLLGQWLRTTDFSQTHRAEFVHLQWHMAMFELQQGGWQAALDRFYRHVMPTSIHSCDALTDAPALLWWLALARPSMERQLPWEPVSAVARTRLHERHAPFTQIHNLLALAGAGDVRTLEKYPDTPVAGNREAQGIVLRMATALHAYATGDYRQSADLMHDLAPRVIEVGGSHAQNRLFTAIEQHARYRQLLQERH